MVGERAHRSESSLTQYKFCRDSVTYPMADQITAKILITKPKMATLT